MTWSYRVRHTTTYEYGATMTDGYSVACVTPRPTDWQQVRASEILLEPDPSAVEITVDVFGNVVHQFGLHEPHASMTLQADSIVDVDEREPPVDETPWDEVVRIVDAAVDDLALDVGMFRSASTFVDLDTVRRGLGDLTRLAFADGRGIVDGTRRLCEGIHAAFEFDPQFSNVSTPLAEVLEERRGVCQDFAHIAVGCLRSIGLAARYVSGYIETVPPPGEDRLVGADASHAWASVWTPRAGWVDFDPTNGHLPVNDHVTVAWGRDYADVIPLRGVMIGPVSSQTLHVAVDVDRIDV